MNRLVPFKKETPLFSKACNLFLFFLMFFQILSGCGKKDFPSVPSSLVPEPPKKLEAVVDRGEIRLTWVLSNPDNIKAINIYRSKIPTARFCPTCPYTFEPVGSFQAREKFYREKASSGYHYAFKVEIEGALGALSSPRIITVEIP